MTVVKSKSRFATFAVWTGFALLFPSGTFACPFPDPSAKFDNMTRSQFVMRGKLLSYDEIASRRPGDAVDKVFFQTRLNLDVVEMLFGSQPAGHISVYLQGYSLSPEDVKPGVIVGIEPAIGLYGEPIIRVVATTCGPAMADDTPANVERVRQVIKDWLRSKTAH